VQKPTERYQTKQCIITGLKPIHIIIKETAELYIGRGNSYKKLQIDHDEPPKQWLRPADRTIAIDTDNTQEDPTYINDSTHINVYTDGSK